MDICLTYHEIAITTHITPALNNKYKYKLSIYIREVQMQRSVSEIFDSGSNFHFYEM